jgi:hypothetical protein
MKERDEFVLHTVLLLTVLGLAGAFAWNALRAPDNVVIIPTPVPEEPPLSVVSASDTDIFEKRDPFGPLITPIPTPTRVVLPTPTPSPPEPPDWDVVLIISNTVQIRDEMGANHYLKEGESLEGVEVVKVNWQDKTVRVRHETSGREKVLNLTDPRVGRVDGRRRGR